MEAIITLGLSDGVGLRCTALYCTVLHCTVLYCSDHVSALIIVSSSAGDLGQVCCGGLASVRGWWWWVAALNVGTDELLHPALP